MNQYIIHGVNGLLADLSELIASNHGVLRLVCLNIIPEAQPHRPDYKDIIRSAGNDIQIISLDQFKREFGLYDKYKNILGFSGIKTKQLIANLKSLNIEINTLIHPTSYIYESTVIGQGSIILPHVVVSSNSIIGEYTRINRGVTIGHNTIIGQYSTIQPGVNIAGYVNIGTNVTIGIGANIIEDVKIGNNSTIAAGAVVLDDVEDNVMVAGIPAKIKKRYDDPCL